MLIDNKENYPDCPFTRRIVEVGGLTKTELFQKMKQESICMNEYGERLLSDDRFTVSSKKYSLHTIELTVKSLGFPNGATTDELYKRASELGLELCPLETAPFLRLAYLNQPEGYYSGNLLKGNQAPSGSITIATEALTEDVNFPKGLYLRRIDGVLWLRGYLADNMHVWNSEDHFIFCQR